jgi:hypothetical protein
LTSSSNLVYSGWCTTLQGEAYVGVRACSAADGGSVALDIFTGPFTRAYGDCSRSAELLDQWVVNTTCQAFSKPAGVNAFPTYFKVTDGSCAPPPGLRVLLTGVREAGQACTVPPDYTGTVGGDGACILRAIAGADNGRIVVSGDGSWQVTSFAATDVTCATPLGVYSGTALPAECVPLSNNASNTKLFIKPATAYSPSVVPVPSATPSVSASPPATPSASRTGTPSPPAPAPRNATQLTFLSSGSCAGAPSTTRTYNSSDCTTYGGLTGASSYACNDAGTGVVATGWVNTTSCTGAHQ